MQRSTCEQVESWRRDANRRRMRGASDLEGTTVFQPETPFGLPIMDALRDNSTPREAQ